MNVLTGIYVPTAGSDRRSRAQRSPAARPPQIALAGIARTFQNVQLFGEMTALENVLVGLHHTFRAASSPVALAHAALRGARSATARVRAVGILRLRRPGGARRARRRATCPTASSACWKSRRALALDPQAAAARRAGRRPHRARHRASSCAIIRKIRDHGITRDPDRAPHGRGDGPLRHASPCSTSARRSRRARPPRSRRTRR